MAANRTENTAQSTDNPGNATRTVSDSLVIKLTPEVKQQLQEFIDAQEFKVSKSEVARIALEKFLTERAEG